MKQPFPISEKADLNKVETVDDSPGIQRKDAMVFQISETPLTTENQQQELQKKTAIGDVGKIGIGRDK